MNHAQLVELRSGNLAPGHARNDAEAAEKKGVCRGFRRIEPIEEVAAARSRPAGVSIAVVPLLDDVPDPLDLGARAGGAPSPPRPLGETLLSEMGVKTEYDTHFPIKYDTQTRMLNVIGREFLNVRSHRRPETREVITTLLYFTTVSKELLR